MQIPLIQTILNITHGHFHSALLAFRTVRTEFEGGITESALGLRNQRLRSMSALDLISLAPVFICTRFRLSQEGLVGRGLVDLPPEPVEEPHDTT